MNIKTLTPSNIRGGWPLMHNEGYLEEICRRFPQFESDIRFELNNLKFELTEGKISEEKYDELVYELLSSYDK